MNQVVKIKKKEYVVTAHGQAFLPPITDEPGIFDSRVIPLYRALKEIGAPTEIICVTKLALIGDEDYPKEDQEEKE